MKKSLIITIFVILFASLSLSVISAQTIDKQDIPVRSNDYEAVKAQITKIIQSEMSSKKIVGLSIALVDDQDIVWEQGFGYQDKERKLPATADTIYQVGSITKMFTVLAAMQLREQGSFDIDQPLQKFLPDFSMKSRYPDSQPITARTIMTHHSGISTNYFKGWATDTPYTELVKELHNEYVAFPPNYIFQYSNSAMTLLGCAVKQISGQDYPDYIRDRLLLPMNMKNSFVVPCPPQDNPLMSKNYAKGTVVKPDPLRDIPAGGLCSNVDDMAHFLQMMFAEGMYGDRLVLQKESIQETLRPQNENIPLDFDSRMGLGWFLWKDQIPGYDGRVAWHGGDINHFHSAIILSPEHKLGVIVLANSEESVGFPNDIARKALNSAYAAKYKNRLTDVKLESKSKVDALDLRTHLGYYAMMGGMVKLYNEGNTFFARVADIPFRLAANDDGSYSLRYDIGGVIPHTPKEFDGIKFYVKSVAGHDVALYQQQGVTWVLGEKVTPRPLPDGWESLVGGYEIVNREDLPKVMDDTILVRMQDGFLTFANNNHSKIPTIMLPTSNGDWVVAGLGFYVGDTVTFKNIDGEQYFIYSGLKYKKIKHS